MEISGYPVEVVAGVAVGVVVLFWAVMWAFFAEDGREAAQKTGQKAGGLSVGIIGGVLSLGVGVLEPLLHEPGLIISLLGLGGILGGISLEVFVASVMVTYVLSVAVGNRIGEEA